MPLQKHISPATLIASVTACAAPLLTASVTASRRPVTAPQTLPWRMPWLKLAPSR